MEKDETAEEAESRAERSLRTGGHQEKAWQPDRDGTGRTEASPQWMLPTPFCPTFGYLRVHP